jgi:hypothetical protein
MRAARDGDLAEGDDRRVAGEPRRREAEARALLKAFERVIRRHRGRYLASERDLPGTREEVRRALMLLRRREEASRAEAALVELASFVPDREAGEGVLPSADPTQPIDRLIIQRAVRSRTEVARQLLGRKADHAGMLEHPDAAAWWDHWQARGRIGAAHEDLEAAWATLRSKAVDFERGGSPWSDPGWGIVLFMLLPVWAIAAAVATGVGLWLAGKSLIWAPTTAVAAPFVVFGAYALGVLGSEFLQDRFRALSLVIDVVAYSALLMGWLPAAILVVAIAP